MDKYKYISRRGGYEHVLTVGQVYSGVEEDGIFASDRYLRVYDENGKQIAAAHLSRFEKVTTEG